MKEIPRKHIIFDSDVGTSLGKIGMKLYEVQMTRNPVVVAVGDFAI